MPQRHRSLSFLLVATFILAVGALAASSSAAEGILVSATVVLVTIYALMELRQRRRGHRQQH